MSDTNSKSIASFNPSKYKSGITYDFSVSYNGIELFSHIDSIDIISSIENPWPIFRIVLSHDILQLLTELDFFGQYPLRIKMLLSMEPIEFNLAIMQTNLNLIQSPQNRNQDPGKYPDFQPIYIEAIPIPSLYTMMYTINEVYDEQKDEEKEPIQIVKEILEKNSFKFDIDERGKNTDGISQISIPPMSINKFFQFMRDYYSLYETPYFSYCQFDGTVIIKDLYKRINQDSPDLNFYFFSGGTEKKTIQTYEKKIEEEPEKNLRIRDKVETVYHSNVNILRDGYDSILTDLPETDLYRKLYNRIDSKDNKLLGTLENPERLKFLKELQSRRTYQSGVSSSKQEFQKDFYSSFNKSSSYKIDVELTVLNRNLINPGIIVKLFTEQLEYQDYFVDKFIVHDSVIKLNKNNQNNFDAKCSLTLMKSFYEDKGSD